MDPEELFDIEMRLLLNGVRQVYGHDFTDYSEASIRRRITHWLATSGYGTLSEAQASILRDREAFDSLLRSITVNVSEMFRDPAFFQTLREQVVPHLKTYPFVKIWHAGCASGEEAYSLAILLEEEGLKGRFRMYATDINNEVLQNAQEGIFPLKEMQKYTRNYQLAGGRGTFSDYYLARYEHAIMTKSLRDQIVFASHNLAVDSDFGEMHLILCRNVLIYFKPTLKERVLRLFDTCLIPGGFLCLGLKEALDGRRIAPRYAETVPKMRIYRKSYDREQSE
ncbi:protein-glutamate O-methyltransferase CheR [Geobacter hydrogenophilus]|uniref:Chemotaxis protein R n=1 Tax=Geobacter hydrogenophilus TaxID=40983 RepID=A0A9W6G466_9BACT|nr:protein-glutamate O-methyltransferase CheR [Geobacter hydrogenophilus]MBT0892586.1 protein-glutamate O-methyltransferase CheR [Geobacter hydrogenophilus]GLI39983.1 chemotaxis protein R [Geobacter hydrogenophilus]